jgi:hypothetical protein
MTETNQQDERPELPAHLVDYRKHLVAAEQKSQEDFDKTVLSLSGGALGVSFIFLKDVIGEKLILQPECLFASWVSWGMSTFSILLSYYFSQMALRHAIGQVDKGSIHNEKPGGHYACLTKNLNLAGVVLFFVGVCSITYFAYSNTIERKETHGNKQTTVTSKATTTASTKSSEAASATARPEGRQDNRGIHSTVPASAASK